MSVKVEKIPKGNPSRKKEAKDYKQYKRLFKQSFQGGLPNYLIEEHKRITGSIKLT